ncbi:hypothetical protein ACPTKY_33380, partial [Pseudomonas aeruginosa]
PPPHPHLAPTPPHLAPRAPRHAARARVDDRNVRQALAEVGGLQAFALAEGFERSEEISR